MNGEPIHYQPYTSPSKRRQRPTSLIASSHASSEPVVQTGPTFVRPVTRPPGSLSHARSHSTTTTPDGHAIQPPHVESTASPTSRTTSPHQFGASPVSSRPHTPPAQGPSRSTASSPGPTRSRPAPGKAPYLPGFQPAGVWRSRTDDLVQERIKRGEARRLESVRIGRRLTKLVELHFPDPLVATETVPPVRNTLSRAASVRNSLSAEFDTLRTKSPSEVWGRVLRGVKGSKAEDLRAAEQAIVKWQDDEAAKRCVICSEPFSFKTRKHHCRLCGRVVCFLPPTVAQPPPVSSDAPALPAPVRPVRCSTFVRFEWDMPLKDVASEKLVPTESRGEVVEIEWRENELATEGVRVCRECLGVVLRRQAVSRPPRVPNYIKLHEVLLQLQEEIEAALPELQDMILALSRPDPSAAVQKSALGVRRKTLASLASYDSLAKRIRDLPETTPGSSRDRLQRAIAARAQLFLAEKMALLKGLGFDDLDAPQSQQAAVAAAAKGKAVVAGNNSKMTAEQKKEVEARAAKLAVLLEQEHIVQSYWEDANARRQFEDASSLKASLDELRAEIRVLRDTTT